MRDGSTHHALAAVASSMPAVAAAVCRTTARFQLNKDTAQASPLNPSPTAGHTTPPQAQRLHLERPLPALLLLLLAAVLLYGCARLPQQMVRPVAQALDNPQSTPLGQLVEHRRPQDAPPTHSGLALLATPEAAYAARLALVQQAQRTLDLQYYLIHADPSAAALLQAVRDAAARGVRVRILLDDLHSTGRDALVMGMAQVPGVQLRMVNPLPGSRKIGLVRTLRSLPDFDRIQRRMHNKIFIADNAWGITGGRNLGDAYFGVARSNDYVDLDVLAAGLVVQDMSASFDRYWNDAVAWPAPALLTPAQLQNLKETLDPEDSHWRQEPPEQPLPPALDLREEPLHWAATQLLVDSPAKLIPGRPPAPDDRPEDEVLQQMLALMRSARHDVLIVTPYFVPGPPAMAVFAALRERGIPVRILTNSLASTTALLAQVGYANHRKELLHLGVELYEMRAQERAQVRSILRRRGLFDTSASLHAKLTIVDGHALIIGSMNLDMRSRLHNTEVALQIDSTALAQQAGQLAQTVIDRASWQLELDAADKVHWRAPPKADFADADHEPDTSAWLRLLAWLLGPLVPEALL